MKKYRIACVVLFLLVFLFAAGCGGTGKGEDLYFAMPQPMANTAEGWTVVPWEVYRSTGGETYSLAYTLPDAGDYALGIAGAHLYYVPMNGGPVTCVDLKGGGEKALGELPSGWVSYMVAEEGEGEYRVFAPWSNGEQRKVYEISAGKARVICEDAVLNAELALGDGGLFYIDNAQGMALLRYDLKTGETRKIADKVGSGTLEYDSGYVYSSGMDTYSYNVLTGEKTYIAQGSGYRVRDGWLYYADYADDSADRDPAWIAFMRRNLKNGKTESCGTAYVPYLGDQTFRRTVVFGKKGFVVFQSYVKEDADYTYFPYRASQGIALHPAENSP